MSKKVENAVVATSAELITLEADTESTELGLKAKTGTVITKALGDAAANVLDACWQIEQQVIGTSTAIYRLACEAVKEADGDYKLALTRFDAALLFAMSAKRSELEKKAKEMPKDQARELENQIAEFFSSGSNWAQYVSNMRSAMREDFPFVHVTGAKKGQPIYPTESALRRARAAAKRLKNHTRSAIQKLSVTLDLSELSKEEIETATNAAMQKAGKDADEATVRKLVEAELRKAGAVEIDSEGQTADPVDRENSIYRQATTLAALIAGGDPAGAKARDSIVGLLQTLGKADFDEDGDEIVRELTNVQTKIARLTGQIGATASKSAATSANAPKVSVGP